MAGNGELLLIVDDYRDGREVYTEYFEFHGYRVATAADGQEALSQALGLLPSMIILDLQLPVIDGWEVSRRLRAEPTTRDLPILALTAHTLENHQRGAFEAGCTDVMTKPVVPSVLESRVRELLDARGVESESEQGEAS